VRQEASKLKNRNANYTSCRPIMTRTNSTSSPKSQSVNYIELKASSQTIEMPQEDSTAHMNGIRQTHPSFAESKLVALGLTSWAKSVNENVISATYTIVEDEDAFEYILDNKELHNFALQIANGMRFLEEQEITHRYDPLPATL